MKRSINTLRLLFEIIAAMALVEMLVLFVLPYMGSHLAGMAWVVQHLLVLGILVTPVILWRYYQAQSAPLSSSDIRDDDGDWLTTMARFASCGALFISGIAIAGWLFQLQSVCWVVYALPTIKFNTAIGLTLLAFGALGATTRKPAQGLRAGLLITMPLCAAILGLANLVEFLFEVDLGIDELVVTDLLELEPGGTPGQMFPPTAVAMALMGTGLALRRMRVNPLSGWLLAIATIFSAVGLMWCVLMQRVVTQGLFFKTIAIPTAVAFLLISASATAIALRDGPFRHQLTFKNLRAWLREMRPLLIGVGAVLIVGIGLSILAVQRTETAIRQEVKAEFHRMADRLTSEVERRANLPAYGLRGTRGVYAASKSVERGEFRSYVESRNLKDEFPGVLGLGVIERVKRDDVPDFVKDQQRDNAPGFQVKTSGCSADLYVITYMDPLDRNGVLLGLDVGSDPDIRRAIEIAIRSGEPTIATRTQVLSGQRNSYLFLTPMYKNGSAPTTPEEREKALRGLAFAPVLVAEAFQGAVDWAEGLVSVELFDGKQAKRENLLFGSEDSLVQAEDQKTRSSYGKRLFHEVRTIGVGGNEWSIGIYTTKKFEQSIDRTTPALIGAGGVVLTTLLAAVLWFLGRGKARALQLAGEMTQELRASELAANRARMEAERLAEIARRTSNAVVITDPLGRIEWINEGFTRITGYQLADVKGKRPGDVLQGPATDMLEAKRMGDAIRRGEGSTTELINYSKDGREYIVGIEIRPLHDNHGNLNGFMAIESDISERRKAEEQVRSAVAMLSRTGAMAHVGGWELDTVADRLIWSDEVYRIHELEVGSPLTVEMAISFYAEESQSTITGAVEEGIANGQGWDLEMPLITAKGRQIWVRTQGEAIFHDGKPVKLFGAFQDVTEQHEAREELARHAVEMERLKNAADAASRAKSEFLANMSHEIRTPLTAILGYADLLHDEGELSKAPERRVQTIDTIRNAGQHLLTVINDILDLSKIEADKMTVESVETSIIDLLVEVEGLFRSRAAGKGVSFHLMLDSPVPSKVMCDPTRLRQILMNLAGNATKFTQAGSIAIRARVVTTKGKPRLQIDVEDTGPGISDGLAALLFAPFSQADNTVSRQHGGTGLGLSISRRLARLMGGDVTLARTELGKGACFRVDLPLVAVKGAEEITHIDQQMREAKKPEAGPLPTLQGRVLLAEDGPDNQRLITHYLKKAGAEVVIAENGRIALEMLRQSRESGTTFDLLLTDMQMPEMDGYTLAKTLRQEGDTIPIVALTAHAMAEDRERCLEAGCTDYASKPIQSRILIETCQRAMHHCGTKFVESAATSLDTPAGA
ncbi:MAG: CHASE domain-containing protein [Pirellulales bacterium]